MKVLQLYDTFTRSTRVFEPLQPGKVGMYACGPTVYDYAHIGNLRTYIFEDILRRTLEFNGYLVKHVVNITDVGHLVSDADTGEDKMEKGSKKAGKSAWEIAEMYIKAFQDDIHKLGIEEPTIWCRATDHITEQIQFIECIEKKGYTYRTSDGIYFDTSKLSDYGFLGRLDIKGLQAGARIDLGEKINPTDFALWKFSPKDHKRQMEWDSPWGIGFPGWHIECSAMSVKYLGPFFDIHCGGEDHITVHHPNEIAQTEACYGSHLANFWMHGHFLQLDAEKMSKSAGEFLRLQSLIDRGYDPLAYRFFCMSAHYRAKLNFTWESLDSAAQSLDKIRTISFDLGEPSHADSEWVDRFISEVNDDLNMPRAVAVLWELIKSDLPARVKKATLLFYDRILGLGLQDYHPNEEIIPEEVMMLAKQRQAARMEKNWALGDTLRIQINQKGYEIEDTAQGPKIRKKKEVQNK